MTATVSKVELVPPLEDTVLSRGLRAGGRYSARDDECRDYTRFVRRDESAVRRSPPSLTSE